jgi:hypothetical protein
VPHVAIADVLEAAEAETASMLARTGLSGALAEGPGIWGRARRA